MTYVSRKIQTIHVVAPTVLIITLPDLSIARNQHKIFLKNSVAPTHQLAVACNTIWGR